MITAIFPTTVHTADYFLLAKDSLAENSVNDYYILPALNGAGTEHIQGQWAAINRVLPDVKTEWVFIANDDFYFAPGWDNNLILVGDCICANWIEPVEVGSAPPFRKLDGGCDLETFNKEAVDTFVRENEETEIENGFNMGVFIKTDLLRKIGGFDEQYDPWGSNGDSDFQYKLEIAGVQPKRNRGVLIYHFGSKSGTFSHERQTYWQKNWDYFVEKWGFDREDSPDIWNHNLHIPLRRLKYHPEWSIYK